MERFFAKNPAPPREKTEKLALKMIHKKIHEARKKYLEDEDYMPCLDAANEMILDLMDIKGYEPTTPKQKVLTA